MFYFFGRLTELRKWLCKSHITEKFTSKNISFFVKSLGKVVWTRVQPGERREVSMEASASTELLRIIFLVLSLVLSYLSFEFKNHVIVTAPGVRLVCMFKVPAFSAVFVTSVLLTRNMRELSCTNLHKCQKTRNLVWPFQFEWESVLLFTAAYVL